MRMRPHDYMTMHVGRSWNGTRLEDDCPCGKAPCGLVDMALVSPECEQHGASFRTMRQIHAPKDCPAAATR